MTAGTTSLVPRPGGLARQTGFATDIWDPYYLHLRALVADLSKAAELAHGRLLDIGCGNKPYLAMFRDRVAAYIGCDVIQSSENLVDVVCPATELPFADGSFDTVLCTQVIEHVAGHGSLLTEAARVLKPHGLLILSAPMYWPLHEEPFDFFRFTEHGLRHLLSGVGFGSLNVCANGSDWAVCGQMMIHTLSGTRLEHPLVTRLINTVFGYLDSRSTKSRNPMNYVVTCMKLPKVVDVRGN